jgi:NAD(P)-dependent dehydrogenase (short-subunit alcohol dehydrogenase family)
VTGGASGLGEAIAAGLARAGARVVVADLDAAGAARVAARIEAQGGTARAAAVDVTDSGAVAALMGEAARLGPLRALVLSAAVESRVGVTECSDEEWRRVLDVNLKGPFLCMRAAIPRMVAAGGGSVVALGSTLGLVSAPGYPAYCASKGALANLCKQAAVEHAAEGVRVNLIAPSATDAGLFMRVSARAPDPEALRRQVAAGSPMRRLGRAAEVVEAALFLASDASSYVTGAVLPVDGGLAARRSWLGG